ncbi:MAG TPA: EAL domain-containing protein [Anaerolineales bacterium]|nr:EAL domain-containing protein [Anaerolineales bacterium]
MKKPFNIFTRIAIVLGSIAVYAMIFPMLYPLAGEATAAFSLVPVAIIGWLLGIYGSLLFGILIIPLHNFLLHLAGVPPYEIIPALIGSFAFTLIGMVFGWIRQLSDRVNKQTEELREEGQILREEIEKRKKAEERLTHDALHDPLTNLPNRRLFANRLEHAIEWNKRYPNELFAVVYLDFDRFKIINDSLGHNVGDELLVGLARRLESSIRAMDMVARMGGDEFAILLEAVKSTEEVIITVKRLHASLEAPFEAHGNSIAMTASIGVVVNLLHYEQIDDILRDADIAMYHAKVNGKNGFRIFDIGMREQAENILKLESDLRKAIRNKEFRIHYQPILSLKQQQLTGFEALVRWEHPERGLLYPADFIKGAEESGQIVPIGEWVLYEACRQMKQWQTEFNMESSLTISVNLSSRQFMQSDLVRQIEDVLEQTALSAESLRLELTEMTLIEDVETAVIIIERLRTLGVGVEIDDFGAGYSSLGYLRHLPVNNIKIDRSFISMLGVNKSGVAIIRAIIAMANSLDMKVIAEGIETLDQMNNLTELQCDYGQGFFFNKALDSDTAQALIKETSEGARQLNTAMKK